MRKKRVSAMIALTMVGVFLLCCALAFSQIFRQEQDVKRLKANGMLVTA